MATTARTKSLSLKLSETNETLRKEAASLGERVSRLVMEQSSHIGQDALLRALSQKNDIDATIEFIGAVVLEKSIADTSPLSAAKLRGSEIMARLVKNAGGALSMENAAELLGISRQAVDKRLKAGKLLAIRQDGIRMLPAFQFQDGDVLPEWGKVLTAFSVHDTWMQISFMLNNNPVFNGKRPVDLLKAGRAEDVIRAVRTYGEHGPS